MVIYIYSVFKQDFIFSEQFQITAKFRGKCRHFHMSPVPTHAQLPSLSTFPQQSGTIVITDDSALTHIITQSPQLTIWFTHGLYKCMMTDMYIIIVSYRVFTALKFSVFLLVTPPLLSQSLATNNLFTVFIVLSFLECRIVRIIQCVVFSDWLLSHLRTRSFLWKTIVR